jgi:hypothetical protein
MRAHRRTDEGEQSEDRMTVEGLEVDRTLEKAERDQRSRYVENDGVAHVRDRNAVSETG